MKKSFFAVVLLTYLVAVAHPTSGDMLFVTPPRHGLLLLWLLSFGHMHCTVTLDQLNIQNSSIVLLS